jgi:hypothetical protein
VSDGGRVGNISKEKVGSGAGGRGDVCGGGWVVGDAPRRRVEVGGGWRKEVS